MYAIGLDVGGSKMAGGLVETTSGHILSKRVIPTLPSRGGPAVLADALRLARDLSRDATGQGLQVVGIGIGIAELVDPKGNTTSAQTIDWRDLPVRAEFASVAPVTVESDVRAAALAEGVFGAGRTYRIFAYVTVGTGISSSLVIDKVPFAGARGNALVLASGPLGSICSSCGNRFETVLEEVASGPALVARYNQSTQRKLERAEEVLHAAEALDPIATSVVETAGFALGSSVGFLVNVMDPEAIIVGGGLGMARGAYWTSFVESVRRHIWSECASDLPILQAALGVEAGIVGAALSGVQHTITLRSR